MKRLNIAKFGLLFFSILFSTDYFEKVFCQEIIWSHTYRIDDARTRGKEVFCDVEQNIYFLGVCLTSIIIIKCDSYGNILWSLPIIIDKLDTFYAPHMVVDDNMNIYLQYGKMDGQYLRKYKSDNTLLWDVNITQQSSYRFVVGAIHLKNNDIYFAGNTALNDLNQAAWVSKIDSSGTMKWESIFDYGDWHTIYITDIAIDQGCNIFIVGFEGWTIADIFIAKFDQNGIKIWDKKTGTSNHDEGWEIETDYENNVVVYGYVDRPWVEDASLGWIAKYNTEGSEIFSNNIFTEPQWFDPSSLTIDKENNIYISGLGSKTKATIQKIDKEGEPIWYFKNEEWIWHCPKDIVLDNKNDIYFIGDSTNTEYMLFGKIGYNVNNINNDDLNNYNNKSLGAFLNQNYPNPFNQSTIIQFKLKNPSHLTLKIFDIFGNEICVIAKGYFLSGEHEIEFHTNDLSSGLYFYRLISGDFLLTRKLIILR
jgi:hypothetical protein